MIELIRDRLSRGDTVGGFVLDGFPRTMAQAEALGELLRELGKEARRRLRLPGAGARGAPAADAATARLRRTGPTTRPRRSSGGSSSTTGRPRPSSTTTARTRRTSSEFTPIAPSTRSSTRSSSRSSRWRHGHDHPQVRRPRSRGWRAPARCSRRRSRWSSRAPRAGCRDARARPASPTSTSHAMGGHPTSKGYKGFPAALCISPNSMVVHGIPDAYRAREGDLISLDLGVTLDGLVADSAVTLPVGEISRRGATPARRLPRGARRRNRAGPGRQPSVSDISHAVQAVVEEAGLLRRAQPRRARRRALVSRGSADPELRRPPAAGRCCRKG